MKLFDESLFDDNFKEYLMKFSEGVKLPPALVVQNIILAKFARDKAFMDVYGATESLLFEFPGRTGEDGETYLITGAELFDIIYQMEKQKLEIEYIDNLAAVPVEALSEHDREILGRHGKLPKQQAEAKKQKESVDDLRAKYNIPKTKPGQNSYWEK